MDSPARPVPPPSSLPVCSSCRSASAQRGTGEKVAFLTGVHGFLASPELSFEAGLLLPAGIWLGPLSYINKIENSAIKTALSAQLDDVEL